MKKRLFVLPLIIIVTFNEILFHYTYNFSYRGKN